MGGPDARPALLAPGAETCSAEGHLPYSRPASGLSVNGGKPSVAEKRLPGGQCHCASLSLQERGRGISSCRDLTWLSSAAGASRSQAAGSRAKPPTSSHPAARTSRGAGASASCLFVTEQVNPVSCIFMPSPSSPGSCERDCQAGPALSVRGRVCVPLTGSVGSIFSPGKELPMTRTCSARAITCAF